jgi:hypothetical protein
MTASGVGTFLGSTFGARTGTSWQWRKAYMAGLMCMAGDLVLCAVTPYFGLLVFTFALGGFGNGLALVHDRLLLAHTVPSRCTAASSRSQDVHVGGLRALLHPRRRADLGARHPGDVLCGGLALIAIIVVVRPPLRALWPEPAAAQALRPSPEPT